MPPVARALLPSQTMSERPASLIGPRFLVASLLLHAVVLAGLPTNNGEPRPVRTLNVQLAAPEATRHQEAPLPLVKPRAIHPVAHEQVSRPLRPDPAPSVANTGPIQQAMMSSQHPVFRVDTPPADAAPPPAPVPPALAALTTNASATEPRERRGKPSTLWLAEYTQQLSGQVGRQKQYPQIARLRGWQGTAIVAIQLSAEGNIVTATIAQSTGHDVLDQQALSMIRHAGPLPALPYAIAGDALTVQLPIVFALAAKD